ncbi:hypothetical protein KAU33_05415 [Candidatus Dependentiae bacterium]|nr:hypothetical protein [Candidatus Dependentiae bacterium]
MSSKGKNNISGISDQADITLLYLLKNINKNEFVEIQIEGEKYNDFTLIFDNYVINFEVKSWKRALSYKSILNIIKDGKKKIKSNDDKFNIIVRNISKDFIEDYNYIREQLYYWKIWSGKRYEENKIVKRLLKKGWKADDIVFLLSTKIEEFKDIEYIQNQIIEYFVYDQPIFFHEEDIKNIVSRFFQNILYAGKNGVSITKADFLIEFDKLKNHIVDKSDYFSNKEKYVEQKIKLESYLRTPEEFQEILNHKFLTPITDKRYLVFIIIDELKRNNFKYKDIMFFIDKFLIKKHYIGYAVDIVIAKYKNKLISFKEYIDFISEYYDRIKGDFSFHKILRSLKEITSESIDETIISKIKKLLKIKILYPVTSDLKKYRRRILKHEDDEISVIVLNLYERTENKKEMIDFIFEVYDLTTDIADAFIETPPKIFLIVEEYLENNYFNEFENIINKISKQFEFRYYGTFNGFELSGMGVGRSGSQFTISEKGVVKLVFTKFFRYLYEKNKDNAYGIFEGKILKKKISSKNLVFLRRVLVPLFIENLEKETIDKFERKKLLEYLEEIIKIEGGIPSTSSIIFEVLRNSNLNAIGEKEIIKLIEIDSQKFDLEDYKGLPTNLFVISTLIKLIELKYIEAENYYLKLIKHPKFFKQEQFYDSFEQIGYSTIPENNPQFIIKIFKVINIYKYLKLFDRFDISEKGKILSGVLLSDFRNETNYGKDFIIRLLEKSRNVPELILQFLQSPLRESSKEFPFETYNLLKRYFKNKKQYRQKFRKLSYFRELIVNLGNELVKTGHYEEAKEIVDLNLYDEDPNTDKDSEWNYSNKVKNNEDSKRIISVRGHVCWLLHEFVVTNKPELMKYAFEETKILLDLDGKTAGKIGKGYTEPDLYVRKQAMVPLVELAHPARRKRMNEYEEGLGDQIKVIAFELLESTDKLFIEGYKPYAIVKHLLTMFSYIRDISTTKANNVLDFFEKYEIDRADFLFIYFAEFKKEKDFDKKRFQERLKKLCREDSTFKEKFAFEFWRIAKDSKTNFQKIKKYWKEILKKYDKRSFEGIYYSFEEIFKWNLKESEYNEYLKLFKNTLETEMKYHLENKKPITLWFPHDIAFELIFKDHQEDFLDLFELFLKYNKKYLDENIDVRYYVIHDLEKIFNANEKEIKNKKRYKKIKKIVEQYS